MKVTDIIASILKKNYVKQVFGLQGGAVVHIFDSIIKKNIDVTFTHHEESAALAAVANAKASKNIGCAVVTTGPGTTNAITGLLAAWQDSIPVIFISGQARSNHTSYNKKVRQVGTQEVNICDIVKPITKYTKFLNNKDKIKEEFDKAIQIAKTGRPGPVWLDLALEVQWQDVKILENSIKKINKLNHPNKINNISKIINLINFSKRPLFILGQGVKSSEIQIQKLKNFFEKHKIPFVLTWNTLDMFETKLKENLGIIGMSGQRGANKSVFNSDLLISVGNHLSIPQTTTLYDKYADQAKKIIINLDKNQLNNLNVKFDHKLNLDAKFFFEKIFNSISKKDDWYSNYKKFNWYEPKKNKYINPNKFIRNFTNKLNVKSAIIIDGGGTALYAGFQSSIIKKNTTVICSSSISSMGTGLAETIGADSSKKYKKLFCVIGDGSFLMNSQDLQTISQKNINVVILLVNNKGYLAIRHTQKEFLSKKYYGTMSPDITFPNFKKLANAYNLKYLKITKHAGLEKNIDKLIKHKGPIICELMTDPESVSLFKQGYKKNDNGLFEPMNLSEMYPFVNNPVANTNN
jgi:acetolactate synthase I/II/III large subunit